MKLRRKRTKPLPKLPVALTAGVVLATITIVAVAERRRPLRPRRERSSRHVARDVAIAALAAASTRPLQSLVLQPLERRLESKPMGLLGALNLSAPLRVATGVLLLDYTLWIWHWLNHRVPALWRFHRVHHVDLDLDAATGARFHFGEMSLSVFFRWLQFRAIGPDPLAISLWQTMLLSSIFFHHSNTRLPEEMDRVVANVMVTPRMHGIHHSTDRRETDSNFASLFTLWDRLHGAFRIDVPQDAITIGVPAYQDPHDVTIGKVLALPLRDTRHDWVP
jgi:sterol desaturase/sphingolipid hydroxylase (fatty acid hydroxylase superfamily)